MTQFRREQFRMRKIRRKKFSFKLGYFSSFTMTAIESSKQRDVFFGCLKMI